MIVPPRRDPRNLLRARSGFTLVELLVVMMIIGILTSMVLFAMASAVETARQQRAESQIRKLHEIVMQRWEEYQTRRVPLFGLSTYETVASKKGGSAMSWMQKDRTDRLRELMRMELPDRVTDVTDPAAVLLDPQTSQPIRPTMWQRYRRIMLEAKAQTGVDWTPQYQGAECLYLIVSTTQDGTRNALEFFSDGEIGDVDQDGMKEILDAWGNPVEFLRWAPGFSSPLQPSSRDDLNGDGTFGDQADWANLPPDMTDLRGVYDARRNPTSPLAQQVTYALIPLIFSAGSDGRYEVVVDSKQGGGIRYYSTQPPNNPFVSFEDAALGGSVQLGQQVDINGDGELGYADNVSNHLLFGT